MTPEGYAIVLDVAGNFVLRYYPNVNKENDFIEIASSFNYDGIVRALLIDREMRGMGKEYWIS